MAPPGPCRRPGVGWEPPRAAVPHVRAPPSEEHHHTMSLSGLLAALRPDPGVAAVLDAARAGGVSTLDVVAPAGVRPVVVAAMAHPDGAGRPVLLVTATGREAEDLASAL